LSSVKSKIIKKLANNYPNLFVKDLEKFVDIFIFEIKNALKRNERIELRDNFTLETKKQKAKFARNPKTNEKIYVEEKYSLLFKFSKMWSKKINEKK
tara:strand:+ start:582 stop:872 length:291 start_codon:yes stop_codon:yes gene_type:complete